jgi:serine/threonine-protein kinase HipA
MISEAYVFVDGLAEEPVICGLFALDVNTMQGQFVYGKSYLIRADAFALDPIHLPLSAKTFTTKTNRGIFGVLSDAGADAWGKKLILSLHSTKPQNDLEYLLAGSGLGAGCVVFSLSRTRSKPKISKNILGDINKLVLTKNAILADVAISHEAKKAFEYGVSMGGARPKTLIADNNTLYLAKFNRPDDLFNHVRAEHAAMTMANQAGIRTAPTRIVPTPHGDVLLVERFDLEGEKPNHHFISAHTLFGVNKVSQKDLAHQYSYGFLAEFIRQYCLAPSHAQELYKRMVFNCFIGNTDDHARNHAFLYNFQQKGWSLSPAYDVLPINNHKLQGIGVGYMGRSATIDNLLSQARRFGLKPGVATKIINQIQEVTSQWPALFQSIGGVSDEDIFRLKGIVPSINAGS